MSEPKIHPDDPWHVILDALQLALNEIQRDKWAPWLDYDEPDKDPKASREGYLDLLVRCDRMATAVLNERHLSSVLATAIRS